MIFNKKQLALGLITTLAAGTALASHTTYNSADGFSYVLRSSSAKIEDINKSGLTDPIDAVYFYIDGALLTGSGTNRTDNLGKVTTGTTAGLDWSVDIFVPTAENLSRTVSTFTNNTASDIIVALRIGGTYSGSTTAYVQSSDGNTTLDIADNSHIVDYNSGGMHVVQVYGGTGAAESIDAVTGADASNAYTIEWQNVTIPAGDSRIIMNFVVGADDLATAQSRLSSVSALLGAALTSIAASDYAKIINWSFADSDSDGIPDVVETGLGLNPNDAADAAGDLDNDGIDNLTEYNGTTDINNADTDGDGLSDGDEVNTFKTDPTKTDTDADGLTDKQEVGTLNYNPLDASDGPVHPVTSATDENLEQHQPQVATDSLGRHHITWIEYDAGSGMAGATSEGDVRYKLLDASFNTLIDTTNITTNSAEDQGHPSIAVGSNNIAYIFWFTSNSQAGTGLMYGLDPSKHSLDGTAATLATVKSFTAVTASADGIISNISSIAKRSQIAVDSNGLIHIAFAGSDGEIYLAAFSATGAESTAAYTPFNVSSETCCASGQLRMALDSNNKAHIVWSDGSDVVQYGMADGVAGTTLINATKLATGTNSEQHISVSVDSANKVYIIWGDNASGEQSANITNGSPASSIIFGSLDPSLDDQSTDAASLATVGFTPKTIAVADNNPWYMHSHMTADNQITISYNTGQGKGMSPLSYLQIDSAGSITKAVQEIMATGPKNYKSLSNYAYIGDKAMVYALDADPKNIALLDLGFNYAPQYNDPQADLITAVKNALNFKGGSSALGMWSLVLLLIPMGLRRALKRD